MYTQDQINAMTADQLKAVILELQAAGAVIVTDTTQQGATAADNGTTPVDAVQTDIEKIEAEIDRLTETGEDLFSEEIANLKTKLAKAKAEIEATGKVVEDDVTVFMTKLEPYRRWITTAAIAYLVIRVLL